MSIALYYLLRRVWRSTWFSFPIQLIRHHLRDNLLVLLFWVVLWGIVGQSVAKGIGLPYLFLAPEYLGEVGWPAFFVTGFALGGFVMAFHITCYILDCRFYRFLGVSQNPLLLFSINNSLIPVAFGAFYIGQIYRYHLHESGPSAWLSATGYTLALLAGALLLFFVTYQYFRLTNVTILKRIAVRLDHRLRRNTWRVVNVMQKTSWHKNEKVAVQSYLGLNLRPVEVDPLATTDRDIVAKVFDMNQLNALIIQLVAFVTLLIFGIFGHLPLFQLPAAASLLLLFSMLLMFTGALTYWLKDWASTVVILVLVVLAIFWKQDFQRSAHKAYGLRYDQPVPYHLDRIKELSSESHFQADSLHTRQILTNWRAKFDHKPVAVLLCTSGGGLRASAWTMRCLQHVDSLTQGQFLQQTVLITGSSGGMIGAAYYRELRLRQLSGQPLAAPLHDRRYFDQIARDKLNPTVFSLIVNDLFFNFKTFRYAGQTYLQDRGYALEQKLLRDTEGVLEKKVSDYRQPEFAGQIPMLVIAPTIVNDLHRLYISPQPVSYLNTDVLHNHSNRRNKIKGIEFNRFFAGQNPDSLRFLSALRMNATFPYITPNAVLPADPAIEVMDAGLLDNFGIADAIRFLHVFQDWFEENTSGVVLVSIRDTKKERRLSPLDDSMFNKLVLPFETVLGNISSFHDIGNDNLIEYAEKWYGPRLHVLEFEYHRDVYDQGRAEPASLSWRLTEQEKAGIYEAVQSNFNRQAVERLRGWLEAGDTLRPAPLVVP